MHQVGLVGLYGDGVDAVMADVWFADVGAGKIVAEVEGKAVTGNGAEENDVEEAVGRVGSGGNPEFAAFCGPVGYGEGKEWFVKPDGAGGGGHGDAIAWWMVAVKGGEEGCCVECFAFEPVVAPDGVGYAAGEADAGGVDHAAGAGSGVGDQGKVYTTGGAVEEPGECPAVPFRGVECFDKVVCRSGRNDADGKLFRKGGVDNVVQGAVSSAGDDDGVGGCLRAYDVDNLTGSFGEDDGC